MHLSNTCNGDAFPAILPAGTRILDLSLVIGIRAESNVHTLVRAIRREARQEELHIHTLPEEQVHITFLNPVFMVEAADRPPLPSPRTQVLQYMELLAALRQDRSLTLLSKLCRNELKFANALLTSTGLLLTGHLTDFEALQSKMERMLRGRSLHFGFPQGNPRLHLTILRFLPDTSGSDRNRLSLIAASEIKRYSGDLSHSIVPQDFLAVRFDRLYSPWINEARGPDFICRDAVNLKEAYESEKAADARPDGSHSPRNS